MTSLSSSLSPADEVVIRRAYPDDAPALERIARLDSQRPLGGSRLVAERDGRMLAALELETGRIVADPFQPTSDLVALLKLRADALGTATAPARGRRPMLRRRPAMARG